MTTTTRQSLSRLISRSASRSGIITSNAIAFIRSGRLSVTSVTCGRGVSTWMYDIVGSLRSIGVSRSRTRRETDAMADDSFDLHETFVHLGLGSKAVPIPDFEWTPEFLDGYSARFSDDGDEGRLVCITPQTASWETWERHPAGEELVVCLSGRVDLIQDLDGRRRVVELHPGHAVVNPANVWHTADVHEPGDGLFVTPGRGTEHRPRGER